jgi:hypothetical protein
MNYKQLVHTSGGWCMFHFVAVTDDLLRVIEFTVTGFTIHRSHITSSKIIAIGGHASAVLSDWKNPPPPPTN